MQHASVLDVHSVADVDGVDIASQHGVEPDATFVADGHIADDGGIVCQETVVSDFRSESSY